MNHVTTMVAWICVTAMVGGCMTMAVLSDRDTKNSRNAIGVECVKAGNEWVSSWGVFECRHKN